MDLTELDGLPYKARSRRLADRARAPELEPVLAELYAGDRFARQAAVFMAVVARHGPTLRAALSDPDPALRGQATTAWLRFLAPTPDEVAARLAESSAADRRAIYRQLRTGRSPELADAIVDRVAEWFGPAEAARLLPGCSAEAAARRLPALGHRVGGVRLAQRHPDVVLDDAARQLADLNPARRSAWWARYGAAVRMAGNARPDRLFDLLERYTERRELPGPLVGYGRLAAADPARLVRLLTRADRTWTSPLPAAIRLRLRRLDPRDLTPLARQHRDSTRALVALLDALPPHDRAEVYAVATADVDRSRAELDVALLEVLPHALRVAEARRILTLETIRAHRIRTLDYTAFLPWAEASGPLRAASRSSDPDERAHAYRLLVRAAGRSRDPEALTEALTELTRLRNEQDPVRSTALMALTTIGPDLFTAADAPVLEQLTTDAHEARDASGYTQHALVSLATALLRLHAGQPDLEGWALRTLGRVFRTASGLALRRGQEVAVFAALRPRLDAAAERGDVDPLFRLTRALGRRAWRVPELQQRLRAVNRADHAPEDRRRAVELWLDDPRYRSARVEEVLRDDRSAVALPVVWRTLSTVRTDLLDAVLTDPGPTGAFIAPGRRWVPGPVSRIDRWLPRQQRAYVDRLARLAADAEAAVEDRAAALAAGAVVPDLGLPFVRPYVDAPDVVVAEAALAALARTDRPGEALPILLGYADSERARVAVYAAGATAAHVPPAELYALVTAGPLVAGRVTSRKEALRLLLRNGVPSTSAVLRWLWDRPGEHPDVRVAAASAARQAVGDPALWTVLESAAVGSRHEARAVLAADPFDVAEADRRRYGDLVVRATGNPDPEAARAAWLAVPTWAAWAPSAGPVFADRLADLADRTVWSAAATAAPALLAAGVGRTAVVAAAERLARLDAADPTAGDPERDRPAHRRLQRLVDGLRDWARGLGPNADRAVLVDVARVLLPIPDLVPMAATLLAAAASGPEELAPVADAVADRPVAAARVADEVRTWRLVNPVGAAERLRGAARALAARDDLAGGLLAVAVAAQGVHAGWPPEWRAVVVDLRRSRFPDVRTAALALTLAKE